MKLYLKKSIWITCVGVTAVFYFMYLFAKTSTGTQFAIRMPSIQVVIDKLHPVPENWRGLSSEEKRNLSALGRRMFYGDESVPPRTDKNFTILVWKHGPELERRLLYLYGTTRHEPFGDCSVSNCRLTYESSDLSIADAVVFHLQKTPSVSTLPAKHGNLYQRWIFISDENPMHTFAHGGNKISHYNGLFNWSMTYKMDSDIPVPYGRTLPLTENDTVYARWPKTKFTAIMVSDCGKKRRMDYINELKKHMPFDIYGRCGTLSCAGHYGSDCPKLNDYKFYLAFENGDCKEYITEKAWWNAYNKDSVPVILGAFPEDCDRVLPPNSYVHVNNFSSPAELAKYLIHLNKTPGEYESFLAWKNKFKIVNEHGYFQAPVYHYCRICEALNYNDPAPKVYENLEDFWSERECVRPASPWSSISSSHSAPSFCYVIFILSLLNYFVSFLSIK